MTHLLPLRFATGEQAEGRKENQTPQSTSADDVPPVRIGDQRRNERVGQGEPDGEQAQSNSCDTTPYEHGKQQWERENMGLGKERTIFEVQQNNIKKRKKKRDRPYQQQARPDHIIGNIREITWLAQKRKRRDQEIDEQRRANRDANLADDGMQRNALPSERRKPDRNMSIQRSDQQETRKAKMQGHRDHQEIESQAERHDIPNGFPKHLVHRTDE